MVGESDKFPRSCHAEVEMTTPDQYQVAYDQYQALLNRAQEYVVYMAKENPLRASWQQFVVPRSTLHLDVGVISLSEGTCACSTDIPRSLHFLLSSLCADWRQELHADLLTSLTQDPIVDETDPEYPEYLRLRAKFGVK